MSGHRNRFCQFAIVTLIACLLTGCTSVFPKLDANQIAAEAGSPAAASTANFFVEMHPIVGKPKVYQSEISKPTRVQEALEASGALKNFSKMQVDVYRQLPNGVTHKLPVEFKKNKKVVKYEQDYALHPNDRVVVRAAANSPLDKFVDQVFGEY